MLTDRSRIRWMIDDCCTGSATAAGAESPALPELSKAKTTTSTAISNRNVENFI